MAKILDGKKLAAQLQRELKRKKPPGGLQAILVGNDPASVLYLQKKAAMAKELGIKFRLHKFPNHIAEARIIEKIEESNRDKQVAGIIVQLPLPKKFNVGRVVNAILPTKDVDGLTDENIATGNVLPATAVGILYLLKSYHISTRGKKIALVGFTRLLNVPLSIYFAKQGNQVTVIQEHTRDLSALKGADIIITATGKPKLITGRHIKKGAVVIDAGISHVHSSAVGRAGRIGRKVVGDVDFDSVSKKAACLTPVPGGVGPMTVISLFINLFGTKKPASNR